MGSSLGSERGFAVGQFNVVDGAFGLALVSLVYVVEVVVVVVVVGQLVVVVVGAALVVVVVGGLGVVVLVLVVIGDGLQCAAACCAGLGELRGGERLPVQLASRRGVPGVLGALAVGEQLTRGVCATVREVGALGVVEGRLPWRRG